MKEKGVVVKEKDVVVKMNVQNVVPSQKFDE